MVYKYEHVKLLNIPGFLFKIPGFSRFFFKSLKLEVFPDFSSLNCQFQVFSGVQVKWQPCLI